MMASYPNWNQRMSKSLLTPKELAEAIGASESSLRRWVDGGRLRISRTAGGHRRIPVEEAVRFIRETGATLLRPEMLGLAVAPPLIARGARRADVRRELPKTHADRLFDALIADDRPLARGLIMSAYLESQTLPPLFDRLLAEVLHRVGALWQHDERGVLFEHRATQVCTEVIAEVKRLLPPPTADAPVAVGAAPEGDPYVIPSLMAASVLQEAGWRDVNFGPNTPVSLLGLAAEDRHARLVWLALSTPPREAMTAEVAALATRLNERGATLVLGGRHAADVAPKGLPNVHLGGSMADLVQIAGDVAPGRR
jgi:excisionase family DNA binding protein